MTLKRNRGLRHRGSSGLGMIELMMALAILLVGLTALMGLCVVATYSTNRASRDTSATLLAQMVLEQISSQHPDSTATITLTDCASAAHTVATAGGAAPSGTGATLNATAGGPAYGMIDWSQGATAVPANYSMNYTDCGVNGHQTTYEVRWNIITVSANETRMIVVSARQLTSVSNTSGGDGLRFALPVTLRGIGGP